MKKRRIIIWGFWTLVPVIAMVFWWVMAVPAIAADPCMQTNYFDHGNKQSLNCNSNDVRIARVTDITDVNGYPLTSCIAGGMVTFDANFQVLLTAQDRYDIGLYLDTGGDSENDAALTGTCSSGVITETNAEDTFINNDDPFTDSCGDIDSTPDHNPQIVHLRVTTLCVAGANNQLRLPNCTSWRQPGSNEACSTISDAFPGSPSKCNCDKDFTIPVNVETANITVTKAANPETVDEPGGEVTFTVHVENPAQVVSINLATIVDDPDNNQNTNDSVTYQAATICDQTVLRPGESTDCTFTHEVAGNAGDTITDKACVSGTDSNSPAKDIGPTCNTATVTITGVDPSAAVTKTPEKAVMTFEVKVQNTSTAEQVFLNAICDDQYGAVATSGVRSCPKGALEDDFKVISTTCGVDEASSGSGTLPATLEINGTDGDTYTCTFEAEVPKIDGTSYTDKIFAKISDDDNVPGETSNAAATVTVTTNHNP